MTDRKRNGRWRGHSSIASAIAQVDGMGFAPEPWASPLPGACQRACSAFVRVFAMPRIRPVGLEATGYSGPLESGIVRGVG
jgi:hypothetical protein